MLYYLILCRSLTFAQRTASALERAGIAAHTQRSPKQISEEGCGYCVKVDRNSLNEAVQVLRRSGLAPKHVYMAQDGGEYQEVFV